MSATTANAGAPAYPIAPVSGSFKIVGSDKFEDGSSKFFKETASAKTIIRVAMGNDPDTPITSVTEKNLVLGLAHPEDACGAELVVWDKVDHIIRAEFAVISNTDCEAESISNGPADGKSGTYSEFFTLDVNFIGAGENDCSAVDTSKVKGGGFALGQYSEKTSVKNQQATTTPVGVTVTNLIGDLQSDEHLVITGGSFKADFTPSKQLGTSSLGIAMTCNN